MTKRSPSDATPIVLARLAAQACLDNKATDVVVLDLKTVSDVTDFFVIASGTSDTHVRSTAEHVIEELRKAGTHVHHAEGVTQGRWVLLDFVDVVVHVQHAEERAYYALERLWKDCPTIPFTDSAAGRGSAAAPGSAAGPAGAAEKDATGEETAGQ